MWRAPSPDPLRSMAADDSEAHGAARQQFILVTAHRRESHGEPLAAICRAVLRIVDHHPDVTVVVPVHPNPRVKEVVTSMYACAVTDPRPILRRLTQPWSHDGLGTAHVHRLAGHARIKLVEPLTYEAMVHVLRRAYLALTDSGGLTEEAAFWDVPTLVLRRAMDRPEAIAAGAARLVGTDEDMIVQAVQELIDTPRAYIAMKAPRPVFGDGHAARRIADALAGRPVEPFMAQY
jgi:UDP-N-acetylglucosamine 2-epimerase (non-hydrolysing)